MNNATAYGSRKTEFNPDEHLAYLRTLHQEGPHLGNQYLEDSALLEYLAPLLKPQVIAENAKDLEALGDLTVNEMLKLHKQCEREIPQLVQFDAFGKRVDTLLLSSAWHRMHRISAEQGIVATAYDKKHGESARLLQLVKLYLYSTSSGMYGCPLAMTDGAAAVLKQILTFQHEEISHKALQKVQEAFNHLTTYNPDDFWTSGQWMSEKRGGSDVSGSTETIAVQKKGLKYRLYGYKWFSSATDCQVTLALARVIPKDAQLTLEEMLKVPLSLFLLKLRRKTGELRNIEIIRLKEKMGTKQLPTAELLLKGASATLISPIGKGIKYISHMLNITRMYNATFAVAGMRRMIALCRDYSSRRSVFGAKLTDVPLQMKVLSDMEVTFRGNLIFLLQIGSWLGRDQSNIATQEEKDLLRISTPLVKLYSGKDVMRICTESLEYFGGVGYMENSSMPNIYRDAQVLSIWEGTTNVLCHDFYRALVSTPSAIDSYVKFVQRVIMNSVSNENGMIARKEFKDHYQQMVNDFNENLKHIHDQVLDKKGFHKFQQHLRDIVMNFVRIFIAVLLLEHFLITAREKDLEIFYRWLAVAPKFTVNLSFNVSSINKIALDTDALNKQRECGEKDSRGVIRPRF